MSKDRDERDEFEHIMDSMSIEFRTPEELKEAAAKAQQQIYEACSGQRVKIEDYKATREQCIRGIMEELGRAPMFNDIMDVVAVSQMTSGRKISMFDQPSVRGGRGYFSPRAPSKMQIPIINLSIVGQIYDYIMGRAKSYEVMVYAGNTIVAAAQNRNKLIGTVIHEFAHFAMYAVFKNDGNPYFDDKDKEKFSDVMKQTMTNLYVRSRKHEPVGLTIEQMLDGIHQGEPFTTVFLSSPDTYNREFVVRLPEIFAGAYLNTNFSPELMACLEPLASYWKDSITPQMRKFIDDHHKGHMVTSDRVYEGNALAHSGENYLMLEGKETPAGIQAQALIAAVKDNNVADCTTIIGSALDDRLPRLALLQAIEHNRSTIAEIALKKIQHPKHMNSLLDEAIKRKRPDIAQRIITYMEPDIISLARAGSAKAITFLLALPDSNVNAKDASEAFVWAAQLGHADALTAILKAPNIVVSAKDVSETLISAAFSYPDVVKAILKAPNIVVSSKDASEALIASEGQADVVTAILKAPNIIVSAEAASKALILAVHMGHVARLGYADVVRDLIAAGASLDAVDERGKTATDWADTEAMKDMLIKAAAEAKKVTNHIPPAQSMAQAQAAQGLPISPGDLPNASSPEGLEFVPGQAPTATRIEAASSTAGTTSLPEIATPSTSASAPLKGRGAGPVNTASSEPVMDAVALGMIAVPAYKAAKKLADKFIWGTTAPAQEVEEVRKALGRKQYNNMMEELERFQERIGPRRTEIREKLEKLESRHNLLTLDEGIEKNFLIKESRVLKEISDKCVDTEFALHELQNADPYGFKKGTSPKLTVNELNGVKKTLDQVKELRKQVQDILPESHMEQLEASRANRNRAR